MLSFQQRNKKRRESKFFGPLDLFERRRLYKSYGHIYIFVCTNTLLLLNQKRQKKRPTNPTIFSASLTSRLLLADPPLLDDDDFDDDDDDDDDDECDDDEKKVLPVWCLQTTTEEKRDAIDLSTAGTKK